MSLPQIELRRPNPNPASAPVDEGAPVIPGGTPPTRSERKRFALSKYRPWVDSGFQGLLVLCAALVLGIVGLISYELFVGSRESLLKFGAKFLTVQMWDPVVQDFGAAPFLYGTLVSSALALLIAVPLAIGTAIFITEMCPRWARGPISYLTDLLAAIPSVIYGLWAIFVLAPLLRETVQPFLAKYFGWSGLFEGPRYGIGMLAAGVILAIMIIPYISSITREVMEAVPQSQKEAAYALGATRWEMIWMTVIRNARAGIFGAIILGLGRAMGETMAVTMVIGNRAEISKSLFAPAHTMASVIANEFAEADTTIYLSALIEIGLLLFVVTFILNMLARFMIWTITRGTPKGSHA